MNENVPAGYQLHITTWENDGDSYKTKLISGLSKADVKFYLDFAGRFTSTNDHKNRGFGNGGVKGSVLVELVKELLEKHPTISPSVHDYWTMKEEDPEGVEENGEYWIYEMITDTLLGYPDNECYMDEGNFCRVFEKAQVYYFPSEVQNVTSEFKGTKRG